MRPGSRQCEQLVLRHKRAPPSLDRSDFCPTGTPLRVTTKLSPSATASITLALSFRNARWGITLATEPV